MNLNKTIIRAVILIAYILLLSLVIFGISSVFTFLNTGADRSKILHTEIKKEQYYMPKVEWTSIINEGRPLDEQTINNIEGDYLDAWYVRQVALHVNKMEGVYDYYTKHARASIKDYIDYNKRSGVKVESTTLEHHIEVDFFSADGKLIALTDKGVVEYKRIYQGKKIIDEIKEVSDFHVIMLLEDGFWRIRHLKKVTTGLDDSYSNNGMKSTDVKHIKGINYYPQDCPWDMYSSCFNEEVLRDDFKLIKSSGLNSVRIFVPYLDFGSAYVSEEKLEKLHKVLDLLEEEDLKAIITLFDMYGNYDVVDWTLNQRHVEFVVERFKDHKGVLAWDIKNEPDLDFKSRGEENVLAWLKEMVTYVNSIDKNHPVTIGWSSPESAVLLKDQVDFVSFHYYKSLKKFKESYLALQKSVGDKPLLLQEFGISSYDGWWYPIGNSEEDQAKYHKDMQNIFKENQVQFMSWTLYDYDHIPVSVVGRLPWRQHMQKKYGFIDKDGCKKPSYQFISSD